MALKPKDSPDLGHFAWQDPFRLEDQLTEDERLLRDAAYAYAQSKLANILFTYELARRLAGSGVTVNALHPGFIASNFAMDNFVGWRRAFSWLFRGIQRVAARSPEQGAATPIYLATDPAVATISGEYFVNKRIGKSTAASHDEPVAQRLWTVSEQMVGLPTN